ncbi:MAG: PilZ domain-containing protein [Candidatus Auribacterota bacterium]|nr:PilZ domain-containing protein [Candidatus Auribacterota bacterium]
MRRFMAASIFVFCLWLDVYADVITLKNGETLTGKLLDQQSDIISFEVHMNSVIFPAIIKKDDVTKIELDNEDMVDEAALFVLKQKTKGLELHNGRWLPKKHVALLKARQKNMYTAQRVAVFSIQFFIFLVIGFALVMGVDLLHYQWRKYKLNRIIHREKADHRLHRRIPIQHAIKVRSEKFPELDAQTSNISLGGLLFSTDKDFQLADHISVEIKLADRSIEVDGLIVRKEKDIKTELNNLGVSFIGLSQAKRQEIAYIIAHPSKPVSDSVEAEPDAVKKDKNKKRRAKSNADMGVGSSK